MDYCRGGGLFRLETFSGSRRSVFITYSRNERVKLQPPPLLRFELEKRILSWTDETHLFSLENQTKSFHCVIDRVLPVCSNCYRDWFPSECPCFTFTYLLCGYFSFFKITFWINIYLIKGYGLVFSYFACYPVQTKPVNLLISPVYGSLMSLNDDVNHCKLSKLIRTH